MDKLDLLSIRYDAELEYKMKYDLAERIAEECKSFPDDTFYKQCINRISDELGYTEGVIPDEVYSVWDIIEKEFI